MSVKDALDNLRKRVEELLTEVRETANSTRSLIRTARPKPFKSIVERRIEERRPLKILMKRKRKTEEE